MLTPHEYAQSVVRTAKRDCSVRSTYENVLLGLHGETGEFVDLLKKLHFHNHTFDQAFKDKLIKEAGDILFYSIWFIQLSGELYKHGKMCTSELYSSSIEWWNDFNYVANNRRLARIFSVNSEYLLEGSPGYAFNEFSYKCCVAIADLRNLLLCNRAHQAVDRIETVLAYLSAVFHILGMQETLGEIALINKLKLEDRYPVQFNSQDSMNRGE